MGIPDNGVQCLALLLMQHTCLGPKVALLGFGPWCNYDSTLLRIGVQLAENPSSKRYAHSDTNLAYDRSPNKLNGYIACLTV